MCPVPLGLTAVGFGVCTLDRVLLCGNKVTEALTVRTDLMSRSSFASGYSY